MIRFQHPKRSSGHSLGLFLLALPLGGIVFQPSPVQAQPALIPAPKKSPKPLSPEQRSAFDKITAIARVQSFCGNRLDLKMQNASLEDVIARIQKDLPRPTTAIEVRSAKPVHVSFDLKETRVGEVLTPLAALAGCKLFVLSRGLLITPMSQLTKTERLDLQQMRGGEWIKDANAGEHRGWSANISFPFETPDQKATPDQIAAISKAIMLAGTHIDLKMEDATLEDVIAHIKQMSPDQAFAVEVRGASPVRVSFDFKDMNVGNLLASVAGLAGCKLYLLGSGFLISPPSQLTETERLEIRRMHGGEWAQNFGAQSEDEFIRNANGLKIGGWTIHTEAHLLFSKAIAQEITGSDAKIQPTVSVKTSFSNFSPDAQAMLQQMADWVREGSRTVMPGVPMFHLSPDSRVAVDTSNPEVISITLDPGQSDPNDKDGGMAITITQPK